ncbi:MAG: winged helix-turn-helix domain-containing protein, partial [Acidobacteriota bacterium]
MDSDGHGRPPDDPTDGGTLGADFKLGEWWVRPQRNVLERGETRVQVEARSMQVLVCLARRAPDLASKAYLLSRVWRDAYVGDDVISHAIWELRKALGDSARQPTYIETIPKKGYRLICPVQRPDGSPVPLVGAQVEQYEIRAEIGRGAMGVVYEAFDHQLDRTVALKFLAPELSRDIKAVQRFTREARMAASLVHPNLATVHEVGETSQGHHYLVTPHYAGGSLQQRIQEGPVLIADAITIARQLCEGLAAAHARDI